MTIDEFASRLEKAKQRGDGYEACCPAHEDHKPSLSVRPGDNGGIVVKCHAANCSAEAIVKAMGLSMADLFPPKLDLTPSRPPPSKPKPKRPPPPPLAAAKVDEWHDALKWDQAAWQHVTETLCFTPEEIEAHRLGLDAHGRRWLMYPYRKDGKWTYAKGRSLDGEKTFIRFPAGQESHLYGVDTLVDGGTVIVTEGERDAVAARVLGLQREVGGEQGASIVSLPDGAKQNMQDPPAAILDALKGQSRVYIAFDADKTGDDTAAAYMKPLGKRAVRVRLREHKDLGEVLSVLGPEAGLDEALLAFRVGEEEAAAREKAEEKAAAEAKPGRNGNGDRRAPLEATIVGALMANRFRLDELPPGFAPSTFKQELYAKVYPALVELARELPIAEEPFDLALVSARANLTEGEERALASVIRPLSTEELQVNASALAELRRGEEVQRLLAESHKAIRVGAKVGDTVASLMAKLGGDGVAPSMGHYWMESVNRLLEANEKAAKGGAGGRIRSGFDGIDRLLYMRPGNLIILAAAEKSGKAQPCSALVLTPTGWRTMGELAVGDFVIGADGEPHRLSGVFDRGEREVFRVEMVDGGETRSCDEHLWLTHSPSERDRALPASVKPLSAIRGEAPSGHLLPAFRTQEFVRRIRSITPAGREPCRCIMLEGEHHLYVTDDFIVTHNTTLARQIARKVAEQKRYVLVHALEMSAEENVALDLADGLAREAQRFYSGAPLGEEEWVALNTLGAKLAPDGKGYIITNDKLGALDQIGVVSERFHRKHDLALIIVDYLQLVRAFAGKNASRENVVSLISRGLKALAARLGVPVLALSQLNREYAKRGNEKKGGPVPRPRLTDLRECLTGEALVSDAESGRRVTVRDLAEGARAVAYGLLPDLSPATGPVAKAWSTGVKPVFRLRTASGRTLRCTANHPLLTVSGWRPLAEIAVGDRIGVPRSLPAPMKPATGLCEERAALLGYLVSDGHYARHRSVGYVKGEHFLAREVVRIAEKHFNVHGRVRPCEGASLQYDLTTEDRRPGGNRLINWLKEIGVHGQIGPQKRVPEVVFRSSNAVVAAFLGALWAGDGSVVKRKKGGWVLKFTSTSMGLLSDVQHILLRFGIVSVIGNAGYNQKSTIPIASLLVSDGDEIARFARAIVIPGVKGKRLRAAARWVNDNRQRPNARIDRLPLAVTSMVAERKMVAGLSWTELGYRCVGNEMSRAGLLRVARTLRADDLARLALAPVLWDRVVAIDADGEEETFDLRVPKMGNFAVNDILAHNSGALSQDANAVCFLHNPMMLEEDPAARFSEPFEFVVQAQRMGPSGGSVKLWPDLKYGRFSEMPVVPARKTGASWRGEEET